MDDLYSFDTVKQHWKNISSFVMGTPPNARACHGFTEESGKLYVHGGANMNGTFLATEVFLGNRRDIIICINQFEVINITIVCQKNSL